jgi:uncharacterized protein
VVGGWNDAYSNAIPRLMKNLRVPRKAIIGPWAHKYPHFAVPNPNIGFLQEMLRWWDFHIKDINTGVTDDPDYRVYIMDAYKPGAFPEDIKGRWVAESYWGFGNIENKTWCLSSQGISATAGAEKALSLTSPQNIGFDGGEYCIIWLGEEFPGNQLRDDQGSITFDSPVLTQDMDIVGQPVVELTFSVDKPVAHIAVRLNDVWPTGEVSRITYHLQNLCMRESREYPTPLEPGKRYKMKIKLDDIAWRIPKGHKLRVSISTSYFPMMWPAPEPVKLTVYAGASTIDVPLRKKNLTEKPVVFANPEAASPVQQKQLKKPTNSRKSSIDRKTGLTKLAIVDDFGSFELKPHGLIVSSIGRENYAINPKDPLSAVMETHWTEGLKRGKWQVTTETYGRLTATKTHWIIWGKIEAYEGKKCVFKKEFNEEIERRLQ